MKSGDDLDGLKLVAAIADAHNFGAGPLFSMNVEGDEKDPDLAIIRFRQGGLTLPSKEYYLEKDFVDILEKTMKDVFGAVLKDIPGRSGDWEVLAKNVVNLEKQIANVSLSR